MKPFLMGLLCAAALAACSSEHDIASGRGSAPVTAATLYEHCQSACEIIVGCGFGGSADECACSHDGCDCGSNDPLTLEECTDSCVTNFGPALSSDIASCEEAVTELFACIETGTCESLGPPETPGSCMALRDQTDRLCERDSDDPPSSGFVQEDPVMCESGLFYAREPFYEIAPGVVCEGNWQGCADGHTYRVVCADTIGSGTLSCSCMVDDHVESTFEDTPTACTIEGPVLSVVNSACAWYLL